jgi:hypothetical protein
MSSWALARSFFTHSSPTKSRAFPRLPATVSLVLAGCVVNAALEPAAGANARPTTPWRSDFSAHFAAAPSTTTGFESAVGRACGDDMVLVAGRYCPYVEQTCLRWLDPSPLPFARCAEYVSPTQCLASRIPMRFCVDRYEYTPAGARLPLNFVSFVKARAICEQLGKRLCSEEEWNFACEGEEGRPYPYGFSRQPICNQDHYDLYERDPRDPHRQALRDLREPSTARPQCVSPFGVYNMVGNLDEPVRRGTGKAPFSNALKGGWWMPARNRCRPGTTAHGDFYEGIQVGVRCCADALMER